MIGTEKVLSISYVCPDDRVAPVAAHVQEGMKLALTVAGQDHPVLTHVGVEEVIYLGNQAFVANHQPSSSEYLLQLLPIDIWVREDTGIEFPCL